MCSDRKNTVEDKILKICIHSFQLAFLLKCLKFKFECVTICLKDKLSISFYSNLHTSYFAKCFLKLMLSNAQRKQCINLPRTQYFLDVLFSKRPREKTSGNAVQTAVYF